MWSPRYRIRKQSSRFAPQAPKRRVNRYSEEHKDKVGEQALRLVFEEQDYRNRRAADLDGEDERLLVLRGVRRPDESNYAISVCNMYLRMGPRRSLAKVIKRWQWDCEHGLAAKVPTLNTLKSWSRRFEWQARAYLFDHIPRKDVLRLSLDMQEARQRARETLERRRGEGAKGGQSRPK